MPIQKITTGVIDGTTTFANTAISGTIIASQIATVNANTITSGTIPVAQIPRLTGVKMPAGSVMQVVSNTFNTYVTTTSTSAVTTGFSATITPSSATSKIFILMSSSSGTGGANIQVNFTVYRNAIDLIGGQGQGLTYSSAGYVACPYTLHWLDSPSTTSSTTYTIYFRNGNNGAGDVYFNSPASGGQGVAHLTLMEIAV